MIQALVQKDIKLFFRNRFFAIVTGIGLVFFIAVYFMMPAAVDETLSFALYAEGEAGTAIQAALAEGGEGLEMATFESEDALIVAVESGEYPLGLVLPEAALAAASRGENVMLNVYYAPGTTPELRDAITEVLGVELYALASPPDAARLNVNVVTEVLGPATDAPIPLRDRMLPILLVLIFIIEVMGLGTLIAEEIEHGTARAVLTTPLGTTQFFASKAIMGIGLAFVQVLILVAITGRIATSPAIVITALLVGSLFVTGIAFLIASVAKDMISVMAWGMLALVILVLPAVTVMFPTIESGWMNVIPSYYLVDTLHRTMNYGASWGDVTANLLVLLVTGGVALVLGSAILRRRFA